MKRPVVKPLIAKLPAVVPFTGPETLTRRRGRGFRARLGANENGFGPSPRAIEAMRASVEDVWMYADPESFELRSALAAHHGIGLEAIVIGEGIDGLLMLLCQLMLSPGDRVVTSLGAYPTFNFHVTSAGGVLTRVPYREDREDLGGLLLAVRETGARMIYVANPDNPMGSWWSSAEIEAFIADLPEGVLLILDEAYGEVAPAGTMPALDVGNAQVLRLRTFSKAYGLAGARIGYGLGEPALVAELEKVRNHFGINRVGQIGALAALRDQAYLAEVVDDICRSRARLATIAADNGLVSLPSATNFVAIDCGADGGFAQGVLEAMLERDIFIRKPGVAPLDRCIRVSCGPDLELDAFAEALPQALSVARRERGPSGAR